MFSPEPRTALLIVRTWREDRAPSRLAMRISYTVDVSLGLQRVETRTDVEQVCDLVRVWLQDVAFQGPARHGEDNGRSPSGY